MVYCFAECLVAQTVVAHDDWHDFAVTTTAGVTAALHRTCDMISHRLHSCQSAVMIIFAEGSRAAPAAKKKGKAKAKANTSEKKDVLVLAEPMDAQDIREECGPLSCCDYYVCHICILTDLICVPAMMPYRYVMTLLLMLTAYVTHYLSLSFPPWPVMMKTSMPLTELSSCCFGCCRCFCAAASL
jgi:hypothetical protein